MSINFDKIKLVKNQSENGMKRAIETRNKEFKQRNIVTKDVLVPVKDNDGNIVKDDKTGKPLMRIVTTAVHIPEIEKEATKLFIDSYDCWFDGCEELRKQYKEELAAISKESCPPCKKGQIWRKYIRKTVEALQNQAKQVN